MKNENRTIAEVPVRVKYLCLQETILVASCAKESYKLLTFFTGI